MANRNKKVEKKCQKSKDSKNSYNFKDRRKDGSSCSDDNKERSIVKNDKSWNDAAWYIPDDKIREQVGTYAVNTVTGIPQFIEAATAETTVGDPTIRSAVAYGNVMEIKLFPYPGTGTSLTASVNGVSALDTACRKLYTAISSVNSKTTQYTPESLGIAIIALGELVSLISYATRLYGVAFSYNPRNRGIPGAIIDAMGISNSILDDLAYYRMQLNKLITAANNVRMLKDIKYFTKCWEIYANYYEDSSSGLAQFYVMRPAGYLRYDETSPTTGELTWVSFGSTMSYANLIQHIQTCLNNLLTSSLMNYVYTDIVNYVTKEGGELLGFSYVGELYSVLPVTDLTFLTQIHNMTWGMFDLANYKVYEDPNTLEIETTSIYDAGLTADWRLLKSGDRLVDFPFTDNPSINDKIDAVMYQTIVWDIDGNGQPLDIAAPDHPVLGVEIWSNDRGSSYTLKQVYFVQDPTWPGDSLSVDTLLRPFSVGPVIYLAAQDSSNEYSLNPSCSLNYFSVFKYKQLKNIFDFAFLGLFDATVKGIKPY